MSVIADIISTWHDPRGLIRSKTVLPREDRALATLMGACLLMFVAEWPRLARASHLDPAVPLEARIGASLMAVIFVLPLVMYGLAWISHQIMRALGGRSGGFGARMALFQALLASTPQFLIYGLVYGLTGPGAAEKLIGGVALAGFLYLWITMLRAVEAPDV